MKEDIDRIHEVQRKTVSKLMKDFGFDLKNLNEQGESFVKEHCTSTDQKIVLLNHFYNARIWKFEDKARDPGATDKDIKNIKRAIDKLNQMRNDQIENINDQIVRQLPEMKNDLPIFTETPGSVFDRLSILELKLYHMAKEAKRESASPEHREECTMKVEKIKCQVDDLLVALHYMIDEVIHGRMQFKMYYQFKMYNDANTNPYIYIHKLKQKLN